MTFLYKRAVSLSAYIPFIAVLFISLIYLFLSNITFTLYVHVPVYISLVARKVQDLEKIYVGSIFIPYIPNNYTC